MTACTEEEFIALIQRVGTKVTAQILGVSERNVRRRRERLERKFDAPLGKRETAGARLHIDVEDGVVLVGSDAHYWPGPASIAHRAFVMACKMMKPVAVIMNGDMFDGSGISRHAPIGWEQRPMVHEELAAVQQRLREISTACGDAEKIWTLGNHDARFETRLATVAPEYMKVSGVHLKDHFPEWEPCWSVWINDNVVVKHRYKGGVHATHNNALWSGKSIVTGHLHSAKVTPLTDYNGTRYGVDTGTMADPSGPQFVHYTEDNPKNWRSGFGVLTFHKKRLCMPELVQIWDHDAGEIEFRGKVYKV